MLQAKKEFAVTSSDWPALIVLPLRLIVGWTFFSAFWRRVVLADELDPHAHGYIGEKFNHFLPHALGIKPLIEYLVTHPAQLRVAMTAFTIVEALVGLCLILGLFTRLSAVVVSTLALGILLGSGWLGSTCVDEWQIGILGVASGWALFLAGGGHYSLDRALMGTYRRTHRPWMNWLTSGNVAALARPASLTIAAGMFGLALATNQYFHGGLFGPLHNDSVKPLLVASNASIADNGVEFDLARTAGPDTYGSFLVRITVTDTTTGHVAVNVDANELSALPPRDVLNRHVVLVRPGKYSLVVPLGSLAHLTIERAPMRLNPNDEYALTLTDISGAQWTYDAPMANRVSSS
ncbi:MAG: TQO small subunit DoxD [Mycobacterium sp.]